ncbi:MAG: hypothetical protein CVT66_07985 [Actinobacteria bacterium HGW-Actinobacteria-6]|jgi:hypothetical protein|nr:MAG: hypothetical protein CVT66_07985 [Actinobacteria bacterium HGW-Actinobacteria-6]
MIAEWVILVFTLVFGGANGWFDGLDTSIYLLAAPALYAAESSVLLLLMGIASADSISGILRSQETSSTETA